MGSGAARLRAEQTRLAAAEQKTRAKAVKAERLMEMRISRRNVLVNVLVEDIQARPFRAD